tara:strand:+ start:3770 stop:5086 length:1317 start_codon:yes stop_codon:yes gene_type:complete
VKDITTDRRSNLIKKNVGDLMREMFSSRISEVISEIIRMADEIGCKAYLVGGFVRDLLMKKPNRDVDIVIEGDGIKFAELFARRVDGRVRTHKRFKTSAVIFSDGFRVDVATAREEYYAHPAALPVVEISSIERDLYRRDFSINAMAICLNGKETSMLYDFFGGQSDLKDHVIRVLHKRSFIDDPTRVFRAVRFEHRLGFRICEPTLLLLESATREKLFEKLSAERLFNEAVLILEEQKPEEALLRMNELGLLKFIHPELCFRVESNQLMNHCKETLVWFELNFPGREVRRWVVMMMALFDSLANDCRDEMLQKFKSAKKILSCPLVNLAKVEAATAKLHKPVVSPSFVGKAFENLTNEALVFMAAKQTGEGIKALVTSYLTNIKDIRPFINGEDILKMGVSPSPIISNILEQVMEAQLDGKLKSRHEALKLADKLSR